MYFFLRSDDPGGGKKKKRERMGPQGKEYYKPLACEDQDHVSWLNMMFSWVYFCFLAFSN